jgi:Mce-associated membrane protein
VTRLRRGEREAEEKATKAEQARKRAAEAARRAKEAEAEAAAALREAEEAEAAAEAEQDEEAEESQESQESRESQAEAVPSKVSTEKTATKDADEAGEAENEGDEGDGDEGDGDESDGDARSAGRKRRWMPPLGARSYALIVVNVLLLGVLGWLVVTVQGIKAEERAVRQVTFAAKQSAEDLSSYDFRTIDADLKRATDHTTGNFRNDFTKMTTTVKPSATRLQAVVEGTAVRTSVESVDGRKAIALVYLNQATARAASAERTPSLYTLRLVMTKVGDRWLVSDLQVM